MRKWIRLILCIAMVASLLVGCSDGEHIVWSELVLGSVLPQPALEKGKINTNSEEDLWIDINNAEQSDYSSYLAACKEKGFTIDPTIIGDSYTAYNSEGYKLNVDYNEYDQYISINLDAPMKMKNIKWPINDLCELLPAPDSTNGKIEWEYDDEFLLYLGDVSIDDYDDYVEACSDFGFDVDYNKGDSHYYAKNQDGYNLSLNYQGFNIIRIQLKSPSEDSEQSSVESSKVESKETYSKENDDIKTNGDFKKAMDEYEDFMDEYVEFMKKYNNSNGTDLSLLADYSDYLSKYADMVQSFDQWEDQDLSDDELAYYFEVQGRVTQKLLEIDE